MNLYKQFSKIKHQLYKWRGNMHVKYIYVNQTLKTNQKYKMYLIRKQNQKRKTQEICL